MKYKNAQDILPDHLLRELQKYAAGETLYIPSAKMKKSWGEVSGARRYYAQRNARIQERHAQGETLEQLADEFGLSIESIRKIVY